MRLPKIVLLSLIFACIGITTEVVFTSISKLIGNFISDSAIDWALSGKTYLWMFIIYACIPLIFKLFNPFMEKYNLFLKAFFGVLIIYIIEFTTGFLLEQITGICPWKYTEGFHLFGYVRLDYFPFWYLFGLIIISVYKLLDNRLA